jgi:hypothetical protein
MPCYWRKHIKGGELKERKISSATEKYSALICYLLRRVPDSSVACPPMVGLPSRRPEF